LKDFGICPYAVNRKLAFYVWHTVQESTVHKNNRAHLLTNDERNSLIMPQEMGKVFTLQKFVVFFYRVAIFAFGQTDHGNHIKSYDFNLVKKLLYVFQKIERSSAFAIFMQKLGKTLSNSITFLPSKELLI
jgi:hypothetical protein